MTLGDVPVPMREDHDRGEAERAAVTGAGLACPHCRAALAVREDGAACRRCGREYPRRDDGRLDLRLREVERATVALRLGDYVAADDVDGEPLPGRDSVVDPGTLPERLSPELFSYLPAPDRERAPVLDLGCGTDTARAAVEAAGYRWVGVDVAGDGADYLADAHALPFADDTFAATISLKVLEHLQHPIVALSEVARVTRPGGTVLGNVAFGEPFHGNSYLHHSPAGTVAALRSAGLEVVAVGPRGHAFLHTGLRLYPYLPRSLGYLLLGAPYLLHRLWYRAGTLLLGHEKTTERHRRLRFAREVEFVARVPEGERRRQGGRRGRRQVESGRPGALRHRNSR